MSKTEKKTQLTNPEGYNVKRIIFSDPIVGTVPNSKISFMRVPISTKNEDGSIGELVLKVPKVFSFGVSENKDFNDESKISGYSLPLCLQSKDGPSEEEQAFIDTYLKIVEACKKHLVANREAVNKHDLEFSDLKKMGAFSYKKDKQTKKIVEGATPVLNPKLIESKKLGKILSQFYSLSTGEDLEPMSLLKKYCNVQAAVKIESIFIGANISLQVKLYEAGVELLESGISKLLPRPKMVIGSSSTKHELREIPDEDVETVEETDGVKDTKDTKDSKKTKSKKTASLDENPIELNIEEEQQDTDEKPKKKKGSKK